MIRVPKARRFKMPANKGSDSKINSPRAFYANYIPSREGNLIYNSFV
jgi:hypothetical protein